MAVEKTRDANATQKQVLQAAEVIFAAKGFAGTTVRDISEQSGVSGPLIMFHFKDKKGVYEAVKAAIVRRYIDHSQHLCPNNPANSFVEHWAKAMFAFYRDNPTMIRLANWARLEGDIDPWPGEDEWHHIYLDQIRRAQAQGKIREDLTPLNISIMICGAIHIWWEYHEHFLKHLTVEKNESSADEHYLQQCLAFVFRGLSRPSNASDST